MAKQISQEEIDKIVQAAAEATVNKMVAELKKENLLKKQSKAFQKTEQLLYAYLNYKMAIKDEEAIEPAKSNYVEMIERALLKVKSDPYFNIIVYRYFEQRTIEEIASLMKLEPETVRRNKNRLIDKLKISFFPDEAMAELLN